MTNNKIVKKIDWKLDKNKNKKHIIIKIIDNLVKNKEI